MPGNLRSKTSVTPDALERIHERRTGKGFNEESKKNVSDSNESGKTGGGRLKRKVNISGT